MKSVGVSYDISEDVVQLLGWITDVIVPRFSKKKQNRKSRYCGKIFGGKRSREGDFVSRVNPKT